MNSLPFEVDRFLPRGGRSVAARFTLLTHAHADHLLGLTCSRVSPVYCTKESAAIASLRTGASEKCFKHLALGVPTDIYADDDASNLVATVTALSADHCLGAAMFIVDGAFGRILHTGDFRYSIPVAASIRQFAGTVDRLFLDCTYCHPSFCFPSQMKEMDRIVATVADAWRGGSGSDIFIGGDGLGKEELYVEIAKRCQARIHVNHARYRTIAAANPDLAKAWFAQRAPGSCCSQPLSQVQPLGATLDRSEKRAAIFVVPWWTISCEFLASWSARTGRDATAILPTACPSRLQASIPGLRFTYSSHSSFEELREFVRALRPSRIAATPETVVFTSSDGLSRDPSMWFADDIFAQNRMSGTELTHHQCHGDHLEKRQNCSVAKLASYSNDAGNSSKSQFAFHQPVHLEGETLVGASCLASQGTNAAVSNGTYSAVWKRPPSRRLRKLMEPGLQLPELRYQKRKFERPLRPADKLASAPPGVLAFSSFSFLSSTRNQRLQYPYEVVDKHGNAVTSRSPSTWFSG